MRQLTALLTALLAIALVNACGCAPADGAPAGALAAVGRGANYLWSCQKADGSWPDQLTEFPGGATSMAAWALLDSGVQADEPRIAKALAWLGELKTDRTYVLANRANVWAEADRGASGKFRDRLQADVERLYKNSMKGSYTYVAEPMPEGMGDQSNSHYAVMGVQAGVGAGLKVPGEYWGLVSTYWISAQNSDGGWPYSRRGTPSSATMTAAGLCTLEACRKNGGEQADVTKALERGYAWMDKDFKESLQDPQNVYYYFFSIARISKLSGRDKFAGVDWKPVVVAELLRRQQPNGSWTGPWGPELATAYAVIVLNHAARSK